MILSWRVTVLVLVCAGVAACGQLGPRSGPAGPAPVAAPATGTLEVEVSNGNRADMVVYLYRSATRRRLGLVSAGGTQVFTVPGVTPAGLRDVRLLAVPVGANRTFSTDRLQVEPGMVVWLRLEDLLSTSTWSVGERWVPASPESPPAAG